MNKQELELNNKRLASLSGINPYGFGKDNKNWANKGVESFDDGLTQVAPKGEFTTSMNRKVCFEAGRKEGLDMARKIVEEMPVALKQKDGLSIPFKEKETGLLLTGFKLAILKELEEK